MSLTAIFIDTSFLLHYKDLGQIEWRGLTSSEEVMLVISPISFRELDARKDNPNTPKERQRARKVLSQFDELVRNGLTHELRTGVTLRFLPTEPQIDFADHDLSEQVQDDRLLASAIEFRDNHMPCTLAIATGDYGLRIKARCHNINVLDIPSELRLSDEPTDIERKIKALEEELLEHKKRAPQLSLASATGDSYVVCDRLERFIRESTVPEVLKREEDAHPLMHQPHPAEPTPLRTDPVDFGELNVDWVAEHTEYISIEAYNRQVDGHLRAYEAYLRTMQQLYEQVKRNGALYLRIMNSGTVPADKVHIWLRFPEGVEPIDVSDLPPHPQKPTPPRRPDSNKDFFPPVTDRTTLLRIADSVGQTNMIQDPPNVRGPFVHPDDCAAYFEVDDLRHNYNIQLDPILFRLAEGWNAQGFSLSYKITANHLPRLIEDEIQVKLRTTQEEVKPSDL